MGIGKSLPALLIALAFACARAQGAEVVRTGTAEAPRCAADDFAASTLVANAEGFLVLVLSRCPEDAWVELKTLALELEVLAGSRGYRIRGSGQHWVQAPAGRLSAVVVPATVDNGLDLSNARLIETTISGVLLSRGLSGER